MKKIKYLQYGNKLTDPFIGSATNFFNKNATNYSNGLSTSLPPFKSQFQFGALGNTLGQNQLAMDAFTTKTNITSQNMFGNIGGGGATGSTAQAGSFIGDLFGKGKMKDGLKSVGKYAKSSAGIGTIADIAGNFLPDVNNSSVTKGIDQASDMAANGLMSSGNPYAMAAGAGIKVMNASNKALSALTGGATTIQDPGTTGDAIMSSGIVSMGGFNPITLANALTKKKVEGSDKYLGGDVSTGKGYAATDATKTAEFGGVTSLFGGKKKRLALAGRTQRVDTENMMKRSAQTTASSNELASMNSAQDVAVKSGQQLAGRNPYQNRFLSAKNGAKINPAKLRDISNKAKKVQKEPVDKFQEGSKVNVIPEGALHKNLNHYDGDLGDSVTSKGIPVITQNKEGDIDQHAEIEKNEVILHKEATDKIEEYLKNYNAADGQKAKDQIATDAGKYLTYELLENTEDNTGLIATI